jgi:pilus assembly protein CpaC
MKIMSQSGLVALAFAAMSAVLSLAAQAQTRAPAPEQTAFEDLDQHSVLTVPARANFPLAKRVSIGLSKSVLVQFPSELKDVLVADPEKVDAVVQASNRVFLIAKKLGQTNAFFFDSKGQQILTLEINVGADLKGLDTVLRRFIPGSNIRIDMAGASAVLSGSVRTPIDAKRAADITCQFVSANKGVGPIAATNTSTVTAGGIGASPSTAASAQTSCGGDSKLVINMLNVEGEEQVMLKVNVAEVQRTVLKQMGINLGAVVNSGNFATALLTSNALPVTASQLGTMPGSGLAAGMGSVAATTTCAAGGICSNYNAGNTQITQAIKAMERDGLVRTLAEPNLTAVSGETAKFLAGGEYPIPMVDNTGKVSVSYKEFGVVVAFTPIVMSEGRISLRISSEVSELSDDGAITLSGYNIKALKKRQANSVVELPSGGSLAIAGLISDTTKQNIEGLPGVKDMPILGTLFRSRDYSRNETELVVIVTPFIVRPTAARNLVSPDKGLAPASDLKANFLGNLNRVHGRREIPSGGLKGDYGFIVE